MNTIKNYLFALLLLSCQFVIAKQFASPYLQILNKDSNIDRMPLLMTTVDANITGLIAEVKVTQIYKNFGSVPIEAQYVFPGSKRAAVHKVVMKIGDRVLEAEIQEKKQARATYQRAKAEGRTTSLLEQKDPGLFTMMVANILPDDEIEVEMTYSERLIPENGKYTFTYPAIGIPSVLNNKKGHAHIKNDKEMGFDMIVQLNSPIAIDEISSKNHLVEIENYNENQASIVLDIDETLNFKDDFIIEYSLLGNKINSGILLYEDEEKNEVFFLLMIEPPKRVKTDEVIPREYIFIVDSSGSMEGQPLTMAQDITKQLLSELKPHELFNMVLFAGGSQLLSTDSMSPTEANIARANQMVDVSHSGGSTNLLGAIQKILTVPETKGYSRTLIVLTDGAIDVSNQTLDIIRTNSQKQNVFVIGVSQSKNDLPAVERLAQAGNGQEFIITDYEQLDNMQQQFLDYVRYPLLTDIKVETFGFDTIDLQPALLSDLFSQRPLFVTGKFSNISKGSIEISGVGGKRKFSRIFDLSRYQSNKDNKAIKHLWAKEKIIMLGDGYLYSGNETKIKQITELGLAYNLLTSYTSFVTVDKVKRNAQSNVAIGNLVKDTYEGEIDYLTVSGYGLIDSRENNITKRVLPTVSMLTKSIEINTITTEHNITKERASITFILGSDKSQINQYYSSAKHIFTNNNEYKTDFVISHLETITEVKEYLAHHNESPWGIINIVTHSSPWSGLSLKLNVADTHILDVFNLNEIIQSSKFKPLANTILDRNSEIRLLGCGLGKHQQLLQMLSIYLGGKDSNRPIIKSPYDYIYMSLNAAKIMTFKNGFALINPSSKGDKKILKLINKKNPHTSYTTLNNWEHKIVQVSSSIKIVSNINKLSAIKLAKSQKNIETYLHELGADWSDFVWKKTKVNNKIEITGASILYTEKVDYKNMGLMSSLDFTDNVKTKIIIPN